MKLLYEIIRYFVDFVGVLSVFGIVYRLIRNKKFWSNNVKIIQPKGEININEYRTVREVGIKSSCSKRTLIYPAFESLKYIKIYNIEAVGNKFKKICIYDSKTSVDPMNAIVLYCEYGEITPKALVKIKDYYGRISNFELWENGYNGNSNYESLEFRENFLNLLLKN